ncbi:MAG: T9SS type A sorting domain-containing protein [Ignavibacteriae bacterium]|nr:T9SS type A sorting domain-containing protein [Ignavibacteriota bacterium]
MNHFSKLFLKECFISLLVIIIYFCSSTTIHAKIIYKEIDSTISAPLLNQSQQYYLDLNDDGIDEYFFNHGNQMGTLVCEIYSNPPSFTNEILIENYIPAMLDYSSEISAISTEWLNTYNGVGTSALYFLDNWPGSVNKFVAVRFKINNEYHYGWIGIEIPSNSTYINIKDCAFDDVAGQMIYAGYKGVEDVNDLKISNRLYSINNNKLIFNSNYGLPSLVEIYDIFGKIVLSKSFNNIIDLEYFNNGIYFVVFKYNNNIIERSVILK